MSSQSLINNKEKQCIIDVLKDSFSDNPSVLHVLRKDHKFEKRLHELCRHAYVLGSQNKGIILSHNKKGVGIIYKKDQLKKNLTITLSELRLAFLGIGISKVGTTIKREKIINKQRSQFPNYYYFWFLGVQKDCRDGTAAKEIKNYIFKKALCDQLPILLETSVEKNKRAYEKYGFKTYYIHQFNNHQLFFMVKHP